jgi:hypothetical protein
MNERNRRGFKLIGIAGSVLVYLAFVFYSEFHFYNLVQRFVPLDFQIVGIAAVGVSFLTALALPISLHWWFRSGTQYLVGWLFYCLHFGFVVLNLVLDSNLNAGTDPGPFITATYGVYILPASVAFYALVWTLLWGLDPATRRREKLLELEEEAEDAQLERRLIVEKGKSGAISAAYGSKAAQQSINAWAARSAPTLLARELGLSLEELGPATKEFVFWEADNPGSNGAGAKGSGANGSSGDFLSTD